MVGFPTCPRTCANGLARENERGFEVPKLRIVAGAVAILLIAALTGCLDGGPASPPVEKATVAERTIDSSPFQRHQHLEDLMAQRRTSFLLRSQASKSGTQYVVSPPGDTAPLPIPGGLFPGIHVFAPGPVAFGFSGEDTEPNTITNFRGTIGHAFLLGLATGSDGETYEFLNDMRVFSGNYVSADGTHHVGTFGFI